MSSRVMLTVLFILVIAVLVGVAGVFLVQNMHLFGAPVAPKPTMHW